MRPKQIDFNGFRFRLSGNYYRRNVWGSKGPSNLHRAVWEFHNGPIAEGIEVHHIDGDTFNNDVSNLECVPMHEHQRVHMLERIARGEIQPPSAKALEKAAEWHKSDEGREWHSQNAAKAWGKRAWHPVDCQQCGQPFFTPYPTRAKFCHANCRAVALRQRRGAGVRPDRQQERLLSGKRADGQQ